MPPPPQQSHIPGGTIPALPPVLAPLDPQNFTHPPPPLPYSYATLLLHAFIISAILLAVPFLAYWMFLRVRKWRSGRLRHPQNQGRGWDEERNSAVDGVRGGGGGGSGGGRGGNIVETMRNVLWGSLRGLTNAGARRGVDGGWRARGSYNTLPLPGMQVKRVEVKRGRTLQQAESRSRWREVSCSRVGEYGNGRRRDDNYNAENRYGNAGVVGRRRTVSGPFGYGVGSGWGRSVQSTGQEVQRVRANIENRGAGGEYGSVSTASSDVASMGTVRKRSVGIPVVGIDVSPPPTMSENCQPQHTTDISDFFNMWDDIPLRETGNSRAVSGSFEDKVKAGYGTRVFSGPVKKENLNTKHIRQQHNEGSRNDELVNADQGRPKRQHWWKGWMRENKRGILTVEEDRLGGLYGSRSGVTKPKIDIPLGVVPPVGSPRRVGNADGCGGNSNDIRFYMRGARNDASFDGGPGVAGDGIGESPSEDKITTSEGDSNSLEWRWGRGRARYDGGEDSSENCEDLRYARFIAASQSSEWTGEGSSTGQGFGESLTAGETDTSTGTIVSASDSNTDTATTLEVLPGDAVGDGTPERDSPLPLAVWVNECERVDDADITAISGQRSGPSSSEASGSETPRPPQSAAALNTDRASAYFSSPASPDSTPSTPSLIPQTRGLKYQSPRPITPPTGTPSIRYHISRPTGHLFLQKVFEPHIKQYGNLLLPPLSRILYEKWRQHSIPLDQKEPSLEEGWHLGLGDGRRERDRWLRLRSGRYEGQRVDGLLSRGIKRRCSDPGVRRCIGKMWTQAVDLVRAVEEEEGGVKKVVRLKRDEALIGQRAMGMMYFPEWFSPGWESEEEEIFRFLHDDGEDGEEETSDQDVNVVLKHVAREKRRELTELLREFSEEMFLKEVDTRLEWWWWQTRGAAAGLAGREAERRRDILLLREGRTGVDSSVEMEKEYYDDRFPGEVQEGMRWEGWRWETDVPEGVRDLGAYCFPKPPQGAGTRYLGRRASVDGSSAVKVDARRWGIRYRHDVGGLGKSRVGDRMLERARRFVRGEERIKFGKGKETVKRKWEESGGLLDPEELFTDDDGGDGGGEKVVAEMRGALRIHDGGDGSVDENNPVLMRVKVDGKGELTRYNLTVTSVVPDLGSPGEGQKQLFISGDGVASTRPVGGGTPVIGNESAATVTRDQNTVRVPCSARSNSSDSKSSSQSRLGGKGMTILMQHRRRRRRERSNLANSHASVGVGTPMGGTKGLASLTRSSKGSVGSGYIAGDEDVGEPGCEALRLSSPIFTSLGFLEARNPSLAESKTGSRVPSWGTDGSGSGESVQSGESRRSVESVSSGYGGEWGWSRLGFKRRRSARSKASHVKSVRENVENEDQVEWEGMEPLPMDNDDGQFDDGEEISEIELIPEDVRGSWGRNGGYLGLGVLRAASEGKRSAKRRVLSELDVSAPEMGRSESRIDTPFERARSALKRNVSTSSCSLSSGPRNVRNPPWFMSLRSLRVPEGSSGSASASGSMDGVGETVISDKEMRKVERLREVGRRVREVGTERGERRLGMGDIEVEVLEGGVDREKEGGTRRRVVSEPRGVGARMGLTLREAERVFWDRSISREVEELWGPVGDGVAPRAGAVRMQVAGEWVELD